MNTTKHLIKQILCVFIILVYIFTISGCNSKESTPTVNEIPKNNDISNEIPQKYDINYEIQGYLFKQTGDNRVYVEQTTFSARNHLFPKELKDGELNSENTSFEYISIRGFSAINNETALTTYTRDSGNGLLEVHVSKSGGIRDKNTGAMKLITEVQYILFIDKETNALLLCQIFSEMDGETQQYFFSPQRNPDHINDILIRAYTT